MSLTLNTTGVTVVDDRDPTIIYQGRWQNAGVAAEHDSTTHGTNLPGSSATFIFSGTSVAVYGTLGTEGGPTSTYNLDDSSLVTYDALSVTSPIYNTLFYQSPVLSTGTHRLVVTYVNTTGYLWLDYLLYIPSAGPASESPHSASASASASVTAATSIRSATTSGSTVLQLPTLTSTTGGIATTSAASVPPSSAAVRTSNSNLKVAAAVGGSLGGLLLLIIFTAAICYKRLSERRQTLEKTSATNPFPFSQQRYLHDSPAPPPSKATHIYVSNPSSSMAESGRVMEEPVAIAGPLEYHRGQSSNGSATNFQSQPGPLTFLPPISTVPVLIPTPHVYPTQPTSEQDGRQVINTNRMNANLLSDAAIPQEKGSQFSQTGALYEDLYSHDTPPAYNRY